MNQKAVFEILLEQILLIKKNKTKPIRIAINGIEGSGKTIFAECFTTYLVSHNFEAIHISIDGFHNATERRYRQGKESANGYYEDSYDEDAFVRNVLLASQADSPTYVRATHDLETDTYLDTTPIGISNDAILITDGAYLLKPVYRSLWDLKIYLKVDSDIARDRGAKRDAVLLGGYDRASDKYQKRYHAASKIYIAQNDPEKIADIVIDNNNYNNPLVIKISN